jgi:hypothetical protein
MSISSDEEDEKKEETKMSSPVSGPFNFAVIFDWNSLIPELVQFPAS